MRGLIDWLDERAGIRALWAEAANEVIPGGARIRYVFGSVLMFLFMQQVVLGILLGLYYSPSATDAWASTAYIHDQITAGWFLRGLHHHGSSAMVIVTVIHFFQVVLAGAYKKPRELNWFTGLAMGGLVLAFALTGYLLPWDQKGYWATQVATGIIGTVPGGEPLKIVLQGGSEYGNFTITHFYALHVFVLPIGLALLLGAHLALFRKHGVTAPELPEAELKAKTQLFFPGQAFLDLVAMAVTGVILIGVTFATHGAELFAPAQPASNFVARPEWYFLFLFQLLKYFQGSLQILATVVIPGLATLFLVGLPWLDRAQTRNPKKRMGVLSMVALLFAGVTALTVIAKIEDANNEKYQEGLKVAHVEAEAARKWAKLGVLPEGGDAVFLNDPEAKAKALFKEHCATCHAIDGIGGQEAPELSGYANRAWISGLIRDPNQKKYFGETTHETMEAYDTDAVSDEQLTAVTEYVVSLMGDESIAVDAALAAKGKTLFNDEFDCSDCHEVGAKGEENEGPNLEGHGTAAWVARVMRDSSAADLFGEEAKMPKFGGKLSDEEIDMVAAFVVSTRAPKPEADAAH